MLYIFEPVKCMVGLVSVSVSFVFCVAYIVWARVKSRFLDYTH